MTYSPAAHTPFPAPTMPIDPTPSNSEHSHTMITSVAVPIALGVTLFLTVVNLGLLLYVALFVLQVENALSQVRQTFGG